MSLSGDISDVAVADVIQFLHFGGKTGSLGLVSASGSVGYVALFRGRIIHAKSPQTPPLRDLLLRHHVLQPRQLEAAEALAAAEGRPISLRLIDQNLASAKAIYEATHESTITAVNDLATWGAGTFCFSLDDLREVGDYGLDAQAMIPCVRLNTEFLLLDAMRVFDERNRGLATGAGNEPATAPAPQVLLAPAPEETPPPPETAQVAELTPLDAQARGTPPPGAAPAGVNGRRERSTGIGSVVVVGTDRSLAEALAKRVCGRISYTNPARAFEAMAYPAQRIVVLDGRSVPRETVERLGSERSANLVIYAAEDDGADGRPLGSCVQAPRDADVLAAWIGQVRHTWQAMHARAVRAGQNGRSRFAERALRVVSEMRAASLSSNVALRLMSVVGESVDRAMLFVVGQDGTLLALGAFGTCADGHPLAEAVAKARLQVGGEGMLARTRDRAQLCRGPATSAGFDEAFLQTIGVPRPGDAVTLPVICEGRTIMVLYADNGLSGRRMLDVELLSLAVEQAGVALENEFLRMKVSAGNSRSDRDRERHADGRPA